MSSIDKEIVTSDDEVKLNGIYIYVRNNTAITTGIGSLIGAAHGYYAANAFAFHLYSYALAFGLSSLGYYGGSYLLKYSRQKDDIFNYGISGGLTGGVLYSTFKGYKHIHIGLLSGGILGSCLYVSNGFLYSYFRESWITYRKLTLADQYIHDEILKSRHLDYINIKSVYNKGRSNDKN